MRRLQLLLLIAAAVAVIAAVRGAITHRQPDVHPALEEANARLDTLTQALEAYAADQNFYPETDHWLLRLGLSSPEAADPFAQEGQSPSLQYWSNGRWYTIASAGPDAALYPDMRRSSVDPEQTLDSTRSFHPELLDAHTFSEVQTILGNREIAGDIRWRSALYDPTNGLISPGDIVRWGGPSRGPRTEGTASEATVFTSISSPEFVSTGPMQGLTADALASIEAIAASAEASAASREAAASPEATSPSR